MELNLLDLVSKHGGVPEAEWSGTFTIFGVEVRCYTLADGQRIIDADSFNRLIDALTGGETEPGPEYPGFCRWQKGQPPP